MIFAKRAQFLHQSEGPKETYFGSHHARVKSRNGLIFMIFVTLSFLLFAGPSWYFNLQNYSVFEKLAYSHEALLLRDLEREINWLGIFTLVSLSTAGVFCFTLAYRLTGHLLKPLQVLEEHMWRTSQGDYSQPEFKLQGNEEEFTRLHEIYAQTYRRIQEQTQLELRVLEKLVLDQQNSSSLANWKALIEMKKKQLGKAPKLYAIAEESSSIQEQRRAS
jgi:hypothetical protein